METAESKKQKGAPKQQQRDKKELLERQKKENEFKKIFQVIYKLSQSSDHHRISFINIHIIVPDLTNKNPSLVAGRGGGPSYRQGSV